MKSMLFGAALVLLTAASASADVQLTMQNGRVTIIAKDASVRQILTEWAKVGHTKIVNVERIPGGPMTLELRNVPEAQALEVLLRTLSGYITAPRPADAANLSQFDRIIIMPTVASARPASAAPPPPVFQQQAPQFTPQAPVVEDDQEDAAPTVQMPPAGGVAMPPQVNPATNRGPVFGTAPRGPEIAPQGVYPGMPPGGLPTGQQNPNQPPPPAATPTAPFGGVAVPGMIVAPPPGQQQPGQVQQPPQPGQPVRRPGGQN